jgi:hypothetical protein
MRLGGSIGPRLFHLSWTYWRSRPRYYSGTLPNGWRCPHHHRRPDTAIACAERYARLGHL